MSHILHENKRTKFITRNADIYMYFFTTRNHRSIKLQAPLQLIVSKLTV